MPNKESFRDFESSQPDALRSRIIDTLLQKIREQRSASSQAGEESTEDPMLVSLSYVIETVLPMAPHGTLDTILEVFAQSQDQDIKSSLSSKYDHKESSAPVESLIAALSHLVTEGTIQIDQSTQSISLPKLRQTHS